MKERKLKKQRNITSFYYKGKEEKIREWLLTTRHLF